MAVLGGFRKLSINENVNYEGFFLDQISIQQKRR